MQKADQAARENAGIPPPPPPFEPRKAQAPRTPRPPKQRSARGHTMADDTVIDVSAGADIAIEPELSNAAETPPCSSTHPQAGTWSDEDAFDTLRRLMEEYGVIFCPNRCDQKLLSGLLLPAAHFNYKDLSKGRGYWLCNDYQYAALRGMVIEIEALYAEMDTKHLEDFSTWSHVELYYNRWFRQCVRVRSDQLHRRPSKKEREFIDACLGHRSLCDLDQQTLKHVRKPTLTTKAKDANAETHKVLMDPESKEHIPEFEYDCWTNDHALHDFGGPTLLEPMPYMFHSYNS